MNPQQLDTFIRCMAEHLGLRNTLDLERLVLPLLSVIAQPLHPKRALRYTTHSGGVEIRWNHASLEVPYLTQSATLSVARHHVLTIPLEDSQAPELVNDELKTVFSLAMAERLSQYLVKRLTVRYDDPLLLKQFQTPPAGRSLADFCQDSVEHYYQSGGVTTVLSFSASW